jgi:hypothetical protein
METGNAKRQEALDLVTLQREIRRAGRALLIMARDVAHQPTLQLWIPGEQSLSDVPARQPFTAAQMVETGPIPSEQFPDSASDDAGRQGTTHFVLVESDRLPVLGGLTHVFDETSNAVVRCAGSQDDPNDRMPRILQDDILRFELGFAVHIDRVGPIRFGIPAGLSVKDLAAG